MAIWVSFVENCRKLCCCKPKKTNNKRNVDLEKNNGNIELTDGLLSGEIKQTQLKEKFEKDLEQKAFKIKELEERLAENGAIVDDLRRANEELSQQIELQNVQSHQPGPGGDSKSGTSVSSKSTRSNNKSASHKSSKSLSINACGDESPAESEQTDSSAARSVSKERVVTLERQCESLQFEIELKNESIAKLQTSLNQVLLRNENLGEEIRRLESAAQSKEEKEEKLRQTTAENARLKTALDSSLNEREQLKAEMLNQSHDVEQLQYRLSLSSAS